MVQYSWEPWLLASNLKHFKVFLEFRKHTLTHFWNSGPLRTLEWLQKIAVLPENMLAFAHKCFTDKIQIALLECNSCFWWSDLLCFAWDISTSLNTGESTPERLLAWWVDSLVCEMMWALSGKNWDHPALRGSLTDRQTPNQKINTHTCSKRDYKSLLSLNKQVFKRMVFRL